MIKPSTSLLFFTVVFTSAALAQEQQPKVRPLAFSLVPGISTNGMDPSNHKNSISLNIFSGYSASNHAVELSGVSSAHQFSSAGLQIAGLANVVGVNRKQLKKYTVPELTATLAEFRGVQFAGACNFVTGDITGAQVSGGVNISRYGSVSGLQLSGVISYSDGFTNGIQISGLANISKKAMSGVQIATLLNATGSDLYGLQIAFWNSASNLYAIGSSNDMGTGYQLGVFNVCRSSMGGLQIGLINGARKAHGLQVGLININGESDGYPISLLTLGVGRTGLKVSYDNVSTINLQILTGSKYITNSLVLGYEITDKYRRPLAGYSIGNTSFIADRRFFNHIELMIRAMNLNTDKLKLTPIYTLQESFAIHFNHGFYFYVGAGLNFDPSDYFMERGDIFPSYSIGVAGLY